MKWEVKIESTSNGYILTTISDKDKEKFVYTEKDKNDETNKDHLMEMLYDVIDFFGKSGNKYDKRRIKICYIKGDDYEGEEDPKKGVEFDVIN